MDKKIYLVDCENVGTNMNGLDLFDSEIYYFISTKSTKKVLIKGNIIFVNHDNSKNALDFIIVSYLGYLLKEHGKNFKYIILSNDKGYDNVKNFWNNKGYNISRQKMPIKNKLIESVKTQIEIDFSNKAFNNLSKKEKKKVKNIYYCNWYNSKKLKKEKLKNLLAKSLKNHNNAYITTISNYLFSQTNGIV